MGNNASKSEDEMFDVVSGEEEVKTLSIVGPVKSGKTYLYETLTHRFLSPHYLSTRIFMDADVYVNNQRYRIFDCPADKILKTDSYIVVLPDVNPEEYMENITSKLSTSDVIFCSRFSDRIDGVEFIGNSEIYTTVTILL